MWFVQTLEDFETHTILHIQRVQKLGLELYRSFSDDFTGVTEKLLSEFLSLHDCAKIKGVKQQNRALHELYPFYGANAESKDEFRKIVSKMNEEETAIQIDFFRASGLLEKKTGQTTFEAQQLLLIEKVADLVDRGMNEVSEEEFGRSMRLASELFEEIQNQVYARHLEVNYQEITESLWLSRLKASPLRTLFPA